MNWQSSGGGKVVADPKKSNIVMTTRQKIPRQAKSHGSYKNKEQGSQDIKGFQRMGRLSLTGFLPNNDDRSTVIQEIVLSPRTAAEGDVGLIPVNQLSNSSAFDSYSNQSSTFFPMRDSRPFLSPSFSEDSYRNENEISAESYPKRRRVELASVSQSRSDQSKSTSEGYGTMPSRNNSQRIPTTRHSFAMNRNGCNSKPFLAPEFVENTLEPFSGNLYPHRNRIARGVESYQRLDSAKPAFHAQRQSLVPENVFGSGFGHDFCLPVESDGNDIDFFGNHITQANNILDDAQSKSYQHFESSNFNQFDYAFDFRHNSVIVEAVSLQLETDASNFGTAANPNGTTHPNVAYEVETYQTAANSFGRHLHYGIETSAHGIELVPNNITYANAILDDAQSESYQHFETDGSVFGTIASPNDSTPHSNFINENARVDLAQFEVESLESPRTAGHSLHYGFESTAATIGSDFSIETDASDIELVANGTPANTITENSRFDDTQVESYESPEISNEFYRRLHGAESTAATDSVIAEIKADQPLIDASSFEMADSGFSIAQYFRYDRYRIIENAAKKARAEFVSRFRYPTEFEADYCNTSYSLQIGASSSSMLSSSNSRISPDSVFFDPDAIVRLVNDICEVVCANEDN